MLVAIGEPAEYGTVTLSPDDKRVALERTGAAGGVWLLELATGIATRLTVQQFRQRSRSGHPTGESSSFTDYHRHKQLHRKVIGKTEDEVLRFVRGSCYAQEWAHDGASILFINEDGRSLYRLPFPGPNPGAVARHSFSNDQFHLSPDGRWIAFNSQESGRWEVYVASFPSFADKRQVSRGGGCQPLWRNDGKEFFYLGLEGKLMAVDTTIGCNF